MSQLKLTKPQFFFLGAFVSLLICLRLFYRAHPSPLFQVALLPSKSDIPSLDVDRNTGEPFHFAVDTINFRGKADLFHRSIGRIPFSMNFFLEISGKFRIENELDLELEVSSDDGFRLLIDQKEISRYPGIRAMAPTTANVRVGAGEHVVNLVYFQKTGPMGLLMKYRKLEESRQFIAGQDSSYLKWIENP